jgi:hypothetical protein
LGIRVLSVAVCLSGSRRNPSLSRYSGGCSGNTGFNRGPGSTVLGELGVLTGGVLVVSVGGGGDSFVLITCYGPDVLKVLCERVYASK